MKERIYYPYSEFLKQRYGQKVYKLPVNLPLTCPNRINQTGCSFCAPVGTGFEAMSQEVPVRIQLEEIKQKISQRYHAKKYIAYFQNYTNTYLPLNQLLDYLEEAAQTEDLVGISISTRPDCIREDYLQAIAQFRLRHDLDVYFELGLQTVNYHILSQINRGHTLAEWLDAVLRLQQYGFEICTHVILNLPYDTEQDVLETAKILSAMPISMVKIHSLYLPYGTPMYEDYKKGLFKLTTKEEYLHRLVLFIETIRPDMAVERLFSRVPEQDAAFSNWGNSWWKLKDEFEELMKKKGSYQGIACSYLNGAALNKGGF